MNDEEYAAWVGIHSGLFWMRSPDDVQLFRLWRPSLSGFTFAECAEASRWLAEAKAGTFRTEHLTHLRRRIETRRREALVRDSLRELPTGRSICAQCGGTGLVSVPHLGSVRGGDWQFAGNSRPTMVVACRCEVGRRREQTFAEVRVNTVGRVLGMTLYDYENRIPNWRELMATEADRIQREGAAHALAATADKRGPLDAQEIKQRVAAALAMPRLLPFSKPADPTPSA